MTTRANIKIKGLDLYIYKHYDGYPSDVMPVLEDVVEKFLNSSFRRPESLLPHILFSFSRGEEERRQRYINESKVILANPEGNSEEDIDVAKRVIKNNQEVSMGGWEVTTESAGDINYLYTIDLEEHRIEVTDMTTKKYEMYHVY